MRKRHHRAVKGSGRSILFVLICIFGGASTEIAAQEPLASGSRVRVTAPECELRGQAATLQALRADTLVLKNTECPLASVTRLDVSGGQKSHALLGAGIGFTAVALGVVIYCKTAEFSGCVPSLSTAKIPSPVRCVHVGVHVGRRKPCETCRSGSHA